MGRKRYTSLRERASHRRGGILSPGGTSAAMRTSRKMLIKKDRTKGGKEGVLRPETNESPGDGRVGRESGKGNVLFRYLGPGLSGR